MPIIAKRSPIGLDVGAHSVKAVQSVRGRRGWEVAVSTRFPRQSPGNPLTSEEVAEIRSVLRRQGFSGNDAVVAANTEKLLSGALELPIKKAGVPMDQIARAEFARIHKCDLSAAEFSWWELPTPARGGKGTHVMAIAYPHAEAEGQLDTFNHAGFRVRAIRTQSDALARVATSHAPAQSNVAVLDLGWKGSTLVLMRNGVVAYERRSATAGLCTLHATLASRLRLDAAFVEELLGRTGMGPAEDDTTGVAAEARPLIAVHMNSVIADVLKAVAYTSHQYPDGPVGILLLTGGGSCIAGLPDFFGAALGIEVCAADTGASSNTANTRSITSSHACAIGLAANMN